jgi:hypothetical protein
MPELLPKQKLAFGQFTLVSPLTPAECVSRLTAMIRKEGSSLSGSAKKNCFRIAWRYQPTMVRVRNSFTPYLIRCHFTLHPMVMGILIGVACMGVIAAVMLHDWMLISMVFLILLAGLGFSWGERELLVYDVATAINAHPQ